MGDREGVMDKNGQKAKLVKGLLRAEMARWGITYKQLAAKLAQLGVGDTTVNIRNKVSRGGFPAVFLVQCLRAMGVKTLTLVE